MIVTKFKEALLEAVCNPRDVYKIALYADESALSPDTDRYTADGEVEDSPNYTRGGLVLTGGRLTREGAAVAVTWDRATWLRVTITARGALIYNASNDNAAVAVFPFGRTVRSVNAPFVVEFPATGVIVVE